MSNMNFGWTITVLGMGITLLTLVLLIVIIRILNKLFPVKKDEIKKDN